MSRRPAEGGNVSRTSESVDFDADQASEESTVAIIFLFSF
jgi:hypothetical protein